MMQKSPRKQGEDLDVYNIRLSQEYAMLSEEQKAQIMREVEEIKAGTREYILSPEGQEIAHVM